MKRSSNTLLSSAYFPSIQYFKAVIGADCCYIERCDNYQKQSYRNRCHILSANGLLPLIVPIVHEERSHTPMQEVKIDYSKSWQQSHWRAIVSAYNSSPFFEFYRDGVEDIIFTKYNSLFEMNNRILHHLLEEISAICNVRFTDRYISNIESDDTCNLVDMREIIHPKSANRGSSNIGTPSICGRYFQVFEKRFGFIPDLSMIDLLFNEGQGSLQYLKSESYSQ